jgi:eukaryotic-like serine/threonine-protein kinase
VTVEATEPLVLSDDVVLFPVAELDPSLRATFEADDGDWGLTKQNSRRTTRVIDRSAADLLEEFRAPTSVPEAISRFSNTSGVTPDAVLARSFDFLSRMVHDGFLLPATSAKRSARAPVETAGGWRVLEPLSVLEDTEVYLVQSEDGRRGVLKRVAPDADRWIRRALVNEARILGDLDGSATPELLENGCDAEWPYLVVAWRRGLPSLLAAAQLRRPWVPQSRARLARVCARIVEAYADLHARGVIHGDVHPSNLLVDVDRQAVSIIDFGFALHGSGDPAQRAPRGGVQAFYAPEAAAALLAGDPLPRPTAASEQYAVAALLYKLLSGHDYLEQRLDPAAWYEAVCERAPRAFLRIGVPPWPELEAVLGRALAKDPAERFASTSAFRDAFAEAARAAVPVHRAPRGWQPPGILDAVLARFADPGDVSATSLPRPSASLNYGATGIAYFLYRAAAALEAPALFAAADLWIERARREAAVPVDAFFDAARGLTEDAVGRTALYHSAVGLHCVDALIACSAADERRTYVAIDALVASASVPERRVDLATGYAGHLIACAALLDALRAAGRDEERERLVALGQQRCDQLLSLWAPVDQGLPGTSEPFYGVAHGWAGVVYAMLRFAEASGAPADPVVTETLASLAAIARVEPSGASWPMGANNAEVWTGWCHGSAGYALLWAQAQRTVGGDGYLDLALLAGEHMWSSPAPETGHLCCGAAGQAYAFLALHRLTGDGRYVDRARRGLEHGVSFVGTRGMTPHSLYKGDLGLALLEAEVREPLMAAMPMFEGERWP